MDLYRRLRAGGCLAPDGDSCLRPWNADHPSEARIRVSRNTADTPDRKNVSLARAANKEAMQKELDLGTFRYNIITLLFFPPYIIFELPVSASAWLPPPSLRV